MSGTLQGTFCEPGYQPTQTTPIQQSHDPDRTAYQLPLLLRTLRLLRHWCVASPPGQKRIPAEQPVAKDLPHSNRRPLTPPFSDTEIPYRMAKRLIFNHPVRNLVVFHLCSATSASIRTLLAKK